MLDPWALGRGKASFRLKPLRINLWIPGLNFRIPWEEREDSAQTGLPCALRMRNVQNSAKRWFMSLRTVIDSY